MDDSRSSNLPAHAELSAVGAPANEADDSAPELMGALEIVEAFTALRHELKLQVRDGRALRDELAEAVGRLEARLSGQSPKAEPSAAAEASRQLAEAVAEVEESLHRAVHSLTQPSPVDSGDPGSLLQQFDRAVQRGPWMARSFANDLLVELRRLVESSSRGFEQARVATERTRHGLDLLLRRVHRQMQQCQLQRVDVLHQPFDAELMRAVDVIDTADVPSTHVAEQLRPAYRWRGKVLHPADVRLAR